MVDTPGRCRELDYCSIGQMRTLVRVPLGQPFVCPECGRPLRAPAALHPALTRSRVPLWGGALAAVLTILYFGLRPASKPRHPRPILAVQQALLAARQKDVPAPIPPAADVTTTKPVLPAHTPPTQASIPPPAPAPTRALPTPAVAPPGSSKVIMECSMDAAGIPSNCTPAPASSAPAAPKLLPPPPSRPAPPIPLAAAPPAEAQSRPFSPRPVAGGEPPYPLDYIHDGRRGEVSIDCIISVAGEPSNCVVHDLQGGRRFAEATVNWLNSGTVRFAPTLHAGRPVPGEERWRITFTPP